MLGNFVNNLKNRLSPRSGDQSYQTHRNPSPDSKSKNIFIKLLNASYTIVSQQQDDDAFCNANLFMLPRVYSQNTESLSGPYSPVSLKAAEKSIDELDNVVEKFMRCINVESYGHDTNVNIEKLKFSFTHSLLHFLASKLRSSNQID